MPIIAGRASAAYGAGFAAITTPPYAGPYGAYDALATVTVPSGGASSITFSAIPQTGYKHLQLRAFYRTSGTGANLKMNFNSNSFSPVRSHYIVGFGSGTPTAGTDTATILSINDGEAANIFAGQVFDILDYTNTNKNKTLRTLGGIDHNGSGAVFLFSALTTVTDAINSLTVTLNTADNFTQYTQFSLYGVK